MAGNGNAPRLRVVLDRPASPQEAAAIVAAVEQFTRDTAAPPRPTAAPPRRRWRRAALLEGLRGASSAAPAWGDGEPWGLRG